MNEKIKQIPLKERPREKGLRYGVEKLSTRELLAVLIRCGVKGKNALDVADDLITKAGGITGLAELSVEQMCQCSGISHVKALELQSAFELSRRIFYEHVRDQDVVESPQAMQEWVRDKIGRENQENFMAVYLDNANHILAHAVLFKGTASQSLVSPREIFARALEVHAVSVILVHNHPSGSLEPSHADLLTTKRISESGRLIGIQVLDHLIVSRKGACSLRSLGLDIF